MSVQKNKEYCIGLDIGTSSTGYAMTNMDGKLLKHKGHSTFGAVLFDEAQTAAGRRSFRSTRRRLDRREHRIDLLQDLMAEEINNVDPVFFIRLNESFLQEDDRKYPMLYGTMPRSIWTDRTASDIPTIYHLRSALINEDRPADIRYVYLALHHIIKYRGNFLMEGEALSDSASSISDTIQSILDMLHDEPWGYSINTDSQTVESIKDVLRQHNVKKNSKCDTMITLLHPDKDSQPAMKALTSLLVGGTGSLKALLGYDGENPPEKLSLASEFEEESYIESLGAAGEVFEDILSVYRWQLFCNLRMEGETISQTMIRRYDKHQKDLKLLKSWVRQFAPDKYRSFFRDVSSDMVNYSRYSGHFKQRDLNGEQVKGCTQDEFFKAVRKLLDSDNPCAQAAAKPMLDDMQEENGFLPLLRININGVIPNQLHAEELSMILDRQGKYYPSLKKNKDKIMSLCTFRLPYFVGPLNTQSPFQKWLVRSDEKPITPWNFYQIVNKEETADGFIRNLTNKCTYLPGEDVLPLHSLLYEEYLLLDEINRVRINGKLIPVDLKGRIIDELFKRRKKVSKKGFTDWLKKNTAFIQSDDITIEGLHDEGAFAASLSAYNDYASWGFEIDETTIPMIEQLIKWSTVFENRGILREKIQRSYPTLTDRQVNSICRKRYTGWGRLSQKLLDGILGDELAENATIIDMMRLTNDNFMRVINNKHYGFDRVIEESQTCGRGAEGITLEDVQELPGSPALKRGIWQAVKIVNELTHSQGRAPKAIFIENTRGEDSAKKGRRIPDRISAIEKLYGELNDVPGDCSDELAACKKNKAHLTDRQYLYFIQLGKCMYSGKKLDFGTLEQYDIDHVLPQSYIKDDSIDNRVLVLQNENRRKRDSLTLDGAIIDRMKPFWNMLLRRNLISRKKFNNLTRTAVEDKEKLGFINRQIVETSQIIRHVIWLFKSHYPETEVRGINARLSANVRDEFGLYKIRELNDTHHAYDAFLACTLGTFTMRYMNWLTDESVAVSMARETWKKISANSNKDKYGIVLGLFNKDQIDEETGEVLRNAQDHICYLKQVWGYRDHYITYKKQENKGDFYDQTRYPAGSINAKWPIRMDLPVEKYGGFNSIKPAYIAAITYQKGKGRAGMLVNVPVLIAKDAEKNDAALIEYFEKNEGLKDVKILRRKILLNQKIIYEGSELILRSCSEAWNAKELYLPMQYMDLLYRITQNMPLSHEQEEHHVNQMIDLLLCKLKDQYPIYSGVTERLESSSEKIKQLSIDQKKAFIVETLSIMQMNGQFAKYKARVPSIGLSDNQGRITNKKFDTAKIILVDQSVTGFYERRTKLWDSGPF